MDLTFFIDLKNSETVGDVQQLIGLYIIQQKLLPRQFTNIRRCGAAGTKEVIDAMDPTKVKTKDSVKTSSFRTRSAMYLSNWITDGIIHACLTVPRSINLGYSTKVRKKAKDPRDARPDYAVESSTQLQVREREYHANLIKLGLTSERGGANEWYRGELGKMKRALRMIGTGTFYDFTGNVAPKKEKLTGGEELETFEFDHRRSPRLEAEAISKADYETLKAGGKRGNEIAKRLARASRTRGGADALRELTSSRATIDALVSATNKKRARAVARALAQLA